MSLTPRHLTNAPTLAIGPWSLKQYHVNVQPEAIEPHVLAAAHAFLPRLLPEPDVERPAGFVVVHRGVRALYLNAYAWVWDNVVHMRAAAAAEPYLGCPDDDPTNLVLLEHRFVGCIWELPMFGHERDSWVRHVFGADDPSVDAYLADLYPAGPIDH